MKILIVFLLVLILSNHSISQPVWNFQNSGTTSNLNRIISSGQMLYICGDNGTILRSSNSGLIWENMNSNTTSDLYSIELAYNGTGYAVGSNGTIIRTADGGNNWTSMTSNTTNSLKDIKIMYGLGRAIAVGENGTFLKLENNVWTISQIGTLNLNSISFNDIFPNRMTAVGGNGIILKTTDSGLNWNRINSNTSDNLNYVSTNWFSVGNTFIIGDNGTAILISGNVVNTINLGTLNNLYHFTTYDRSSILCGANGTIIANGRPIVTNINTKLNSVIQLGIDNCFVTGNDGLILYTNSLNVSPNGKLLNSNNINTWFQNNGLFNHNPSGYSGLEWPKGEGKYAAYTSGTVIGAIVNGDTLVTVCKYGSEYLPGYTDNNGVPHGNGNADYKLYKITFNQNDSDRITWPNILLGNSDQGAPVYFDSLTMILKPIDYGNQTMFYSYTDSYPESHNQYSGGTAPLKADIKQINWSFNQPEELKNIIYQEYRIINRSNNVWTNAHLNLYSDHDLGDASDDKGGVDTNYSLTYIYNATNEDGVYGFAPPAIGFVVIRSPLVNTGNMNDTVFYCEGKRKKFKIGYKEIDLGSTIIVREDFQEPANYIANYNAIRGLNNNGEPFINPITGLTTRFEYSGDPVKNTGWLCPGATDRKFYQGFGPLNMNPGDTQVIIIAQVIARGSSNLNSITKLRETSQTAKDFYNDCFSNVVIGINNISSPVPGNFTLNQNYPNPFNPGTVITYQLLSVVNVTLKIFDITGKLVKTLVDNRQSAGEYSVKFDGSNLSSGIYFYSLYINKNIMETKKMLLIK